MYEALTDLPKQTTIVLQTKEKMPVYHSSFNGYAGASICNTVVLPLKTKVKGPAPPQKAEEMDIIDEAIESFRANVLFKKYKTEGPADLTIAYLTVFIAETLRFFSKCANRVDAFKKVQHECLNTLFAKLCVHDIILVFDHAMYVCAICTGFTTKI